MIYNRRLATANIGVAIAAFGIATFMALMQSLSRASLDLPWRSAKMYYLSVTGHGVLMALVFTTFFIMALGVAFTTSALDRPLKWPKVGWVAFWIAVLGTAMTTWAILWGKATVLYTFYPPLQAHWAFYVGATLLVVGSWVWGAVVIATYLAWKKDNPGKPVPLAVYGILTTIIVWYLATVAVASEMLFLLIPWSLGLKETVVSINRVSKTVKGGKRFSFGILVVVGDMKGKVGCGLGKSKDIQFAIQKGAAKARKSMIHFALINDTIPHETIGVFGAGRVWMKPAAPGTGVIAGSAWFG